MVDMKKLIARRDQIASIPLGVGFEEVLGVLEVDHVARRFEAAAVSTVATCRDGRLDAAAVGRQVAAAGRLAELADTDVYHAGIVLTGWPYWFM